MKNNTIPEAIGIFVSLAGAAVMVGWFLNIEVLRSILPVWTSMKFMTAFSFLLTGISFYFIARFQRRERDLAVIVIPLLSMVILLLMSSLLASVVLGVESGVEEMFIKDTTKATGSVTPGMPCVVTMLSFILIALAGIITTIDRIRLNKVLVIFGVIVAIIGLTAVLGYIIHQPLLYFAVPGKSSAMAIHTAILFVLWGTGVVLLDRNN